MTNLLGGIHADIIAIMQKDQSVKLWNGTMDFVF